MSGKAGAAAKARYSGFTFSTASSGFPFRSLTQPSAFRSISKAKLIAGENQRSAASSAGVKSIKSRMERPLSRNGRSEEHTSELQSRENLVCRLLLEKKKPHNE